MVKNPPAKQETGLILGSGRSPGEGKGNPLQYSCLGNPMDREASRATVSKKAKVTLSCPILCEPVGCRVGSQRAGHDRATEQQNKSVLRPVQPAPESVLGNFYHPRRS